MEQKSKKLTDILNEAKEKLRDINTAEAAEELRVKILGKKGELTGILRSMGELSAEDRKTLGQKANTVREEVETLLTKKFAAIKESGRAAKFKAERIDVTEPGSAPTIGVKHPITIMIEEISDIFIGMGYQIAEGPEVETVFHNFDALNAPKNHPSRDLTDTFYITEDTLLRTQTSPVQIRTLTSSEPPIQVISPGRCFRFDAPDATHSPMFHQIEGLVVDQNVSMTDLKGTLDEFAKKLFGPKTKTKFRPHYFPFTEPSAEVDVTCFKCGGSGCRVCKGSGWIEILGCGLVHPNVLKVGGIDTERYSGFAFGMGVERIALLKYEIDDIRLLYENDMRFINQFK